MGAWGQAIRGAAHGLPAKTTEQVHHGSRQAGQGRQRANVRRDAAERRVWSGASWRQPRAGRQRANVLSPTTCLGPACGPHVWQNVAGAADWRRQARASLWMWPGTYMLPTVPPAAPLPRGPQHGAHAAAHDRRRAEMGHRAGVRAGEATDVRLARLELQATRLGKPGVP